MASRVDRVEPAEHEVSSSAPRHEARRHDPKQHDRRSNRVFVASLLVVLLAAVGLRALPLTSGLPYPSYVDEHFVLRPAAGMIADRTWEPASYNYPPLTMYATVAASAVLHILPGGGSVGAAARTTIDQPIASRIDSTDLIVAGRLVVLIFSAGAVLLAALLALRLMGRRAAIIAALLTAAIPALVTRGAIVIVDTPAAFLLNGSSLVRCLRARSAPRTEGEPDLRVAAVLGRVR
jgi:hypothetical protein